MQRPHWAIWLPLFAVSALALGHSAAVRHNTGDLEVAGTVRRAKALASSSGRSAAPPPSSVLGTDPFGNPIVGGLHTETTQTGAELSSARLLPGYAERRPLPAADGVPKKSAVFSRYDQPGPGYTMLDPKSFGYSSLAQLEREVRLRLHIPDDAHVTVLSHERNGKAGVAIEVVPRQKEQAR